MEINKNVIFKLLKEIKKKILEVEIILDGYKFISYLNGEAERGISAPEGDEMNQKLRDIIYYFCKYYPRRLIRTFLVKLIYLTDVEFYKRYGRQTTDLVWEFSNHGPFDSAILNETEMMFSDDLINILELTSSYDSPKYVYTCRKHHEISHLDEHTLKVLDYVNSYFSKFGFEELLNYVYTNPPTCLFNKGQIIDFSYWIENFDLPASSKIRINRTKNKLIQALANRFKGKKFDLEDYKDDSGEANDYALLTRHYLQKSE